MNPSQILYLLINERTSKSVNREHWGKGKWVFVGILGEKSKRMKERMIR